MLPWLGNFLASSIGRKIVVAMTGLLLIGFLVEHLYGNLKLTPLFGDSDGASFGAYRDELHGWGWLLQVAEIGLFALFAAHAFLAIRLTLENREARKRGYVLRNDRGAKTAGSASMFVTGTLVLAYVIKHLLDFRFDSAYQDDPYGTLSATLGQPLQGGIYVIAMAVLGLHLSHGFQSALQSLGFHHPKWTPLVKLLGWILALAFAAGFASIPIYFLTTGS